MNLFEDLVEELKDENLLEETVIETADQENQEFIEAQNVQQKEQTEKINSQYDQESQNESLNPSAINEEVVVDEYSSESEVSESTESLSLVNSEINSEFQQSSESVISENLINDDIIYPEPNQPSKENEFYRRRATEEVSSLKIVEHILSGVEREHMKISPKSYDDVSVSVALHDFLKITESAQSPEHAQAEFRLMQETESWYSSLSYRDKHISVGDLRRYCESSRPPLSSQALISLARFYRNSPFSEPVRSKFDMVVTRLLSKEISNNQRELVLEKDELVKQLIGLYQDWSSIPLYAPDDDPEVLIATLKFQDFVTEASKADSFEELIKNDFFNRLRLFKESTGENFFAPLLTATAIESNIAIGNTYVELVSKERQKETVAELEDKYKFLVDQVVSDTTSKSLQLVELLKEQKQEAKNEYKELTEEKEYLEVPQNSSQSVYSEQKTNFDFFGISKWVYAFAIIAVLLGGSLYVWVEYLTPQPKTSSPVKNVNLDNSPLKEFYKTARVSNDKFYAITLPNWETLSKETREDLLKKTLEIGKEKGFKTVHLINQEGKTVGFASENGIDLTQQ